MVRRGTYSSPTRWPSPFSVLADSECIRFLVVDAAIAVSELLLLLALALEPAGVAAAGADDGV